MCVCVQEAGGEEHEAPAQEEDVPDDTQDEYWTHMHSVQKTALGSLSQTHDGLFLIYSGGEGVRQIGQIFKCVFRHFFFSISPV